MTYTHTVVKSQKGHAGKWFHYAGTAYPDADEAIRAARRFASAQCAAGVGGHGTRIWVRSRKGNREIVTFSWPDGLVTMTDWRSTGASGAS